MKKIAVIGAGISGVVLANQCHKKGISVTLFDKSRGVSGRSTSKRWDATTGIAIDMGVPYIYESEISFDSIPIYNHLIEQSVLTPWVLKQNKNQDVTNFKTFVGQPKMSSIARYLASDIPIVTEARITNISRSNLWEVSSDTETYGPFDIVVLAIPAQQYDLTSGIPIDLMQFAESINYEAVNTLLLEMKSPLWFDEFNEDVINSPIIKTVIADYQKPGRESGRYTYAIHAQPSWSTKTFDELSKEETESIILQDVLSTYNRSQSLVLKSLCHRWRFAQLAGPIESAQKDFIQSATKDLYAIGDWVSGHTFAAAIESGSKLAHTILNESS